MKASEVTPEVIGKRVSCIENGYRVTGTIIGIVDTEYELGVRIKFDVPLTCWSGNFNTESWVETEYDSTLAKHGVRDNLQYTRILETGGPMDWLESYRPKNEHFTTFEEVDMIVGKLEDVQARIDRISKDIKAIEAYRKYKPIKV